MGSWVNISESWYNLAENADRPADFIENKVLFLFKKMVDALGLEPRTR
jgi:hypothetical protein